jgi:hypothetical protein
MRVDNRDLEIQFFWITPDFVNDIAVDRLLADELVRGCRAGKGDRRGYRRVR